MISKELFIKVTGINVNNVTFENNRIYYDDFTAIEKEINIYELAHKCKEWLENKGYYTMSGTWALANEKQKACILGKPKPIENFIADTEIEAIFKATQWVLDNVKTSSIS